MISKYLTICLLVLLTSSNSLFANFTDKDLVDRSGFSRVKLINHCTEQDDCALGIIKTTKSLAKKSISKTWDFFCSSMHLASNKIRRNPVTFTLLTTCLLAPVVAADCWAHCCEPNHCFSVCSNGASDMSGCSKIITQIVKQHPSWTCWNPWVTPYGCPSDVVLIPEEG